jgi:hypothetical protein
MSIVRMKRWKSYFRDGKSSVEYTTGGIDEVAVAVILGFESAKIGPKDREIDAETEILNLADRIRAARRKIAKRKATT